MPIHLPGFFRLSKSHPASLLTATLLLSGLAGSLMILVPSESDAQTAPAKAAPKPALAAPKPAPKPAEKTAEVETTAKVALVESQPVIHARSAAITACLPAISELSRLTLDAPHIAISTWNKVEANDHMFSSIAGLKYDNAIAPRALAVIAAAPNPKRACDGEAIQIQPSSLSCEAIQKNLTGPNLKTQDLNGITMILSEGPLRFALLPTSGNGCTVVSIGAYFAK